MSYKILITTFALFQSVILIAQTNTTISSGETGNTLLSSIRSNYEPSSTLGYNSARDTLYKVIDKQSDDSLECIYSGFKILLDTGDGVDPSTDADSKGINCEHAWPQSKGASDEPQKSNMHHLFPCKKTVNSSRSNKPFANITDSYTDNWYKRSSTLTSIPTSNINDYAEKENDFEPATFEPRESVKGDIARAMFYFYAIYESAANETFWNQMKDNLRNWHYADPATAAEQTRSNAIAGYQNDKYNPFCFDSTLARRAWFSSSASLALANEAFYPYCTSIENSGSNPSNWSADGFSVSETSVKTGDYSYRASAGTSYDFIYSPSFDLSDVTSGNGKMVFWVRTTSSVYDNFGEMTVYADLGDDGVYETEVQTYSDNTSFSSGSYAKLTITLPDAVLGQYNVRFRFAFNRSTGNSGNWNFDDFSIINTASSVLFINEIDYDDPSTDDEEFIELCGLAGNYTDVTIKLINGSSGSVYRTVELGYITISNETEGYGYFVWAPTSTTDAEVDVSSGTSIQNGSPDGVQVDIGGVIIDAVSYEDSGNSMNDSDGNAMEHTDLSGGTEAAANTTIGRQGFDGSAWELQTRTIGAVNSLADGSSQGYGQVITGSVDHFRMMSSPVDGQIYSDLLAELWTQGMTGADADYTGNDNANVWTYSGTSWTALTDISGSGDGASLNAGQGFLVRVYADTDNDGVNDLPVTLSVSGEENSATVSISTTEGSDGGGQGTGWNLLGNPFATTIDADELFTDNTKFNQVVYVYDHSGSSASSPDEDVSGGGIYRVWNSASAGSLINGLIAPYQGFFVQTDTDWESGTEYQFQEDAKSSSAGTFYKTMNDSSGSMSFAIASGDYSDITFVSFMNNGEGGIDNADAYKLLPMTASERVVGISYADGNGLDISNLPYTHDGAIDIPLDIMYLTVDADYNFVTNENEVTMNWDLSSLPETIIGLTLTNNTTGETTDLLQTDELTFITTAKGSFPAYGTNGVNIYPEVGESHFTLTVAYSALSSADESTNVPKEFALHPAYPNPFNPSTTIAFDVPGQSRHAVSLQIFNINGQLVETLIRERMEPGTHTIQWNPVNLSSGVYIVQLEAGETVFNQKITFIK